MRIKGFFSFKITPFLRENRGQFFRTSKKNQKEQYLAPAIAVFDIVENTYLLAASPNARPGGDGDPAGSITIEAPKHEDGGDSDNLEG